MVTWHLTRKLFTAKCHERATLRKLWRQTGNSSLLPAKCWPLLHVIRACSWRWPDVVAGISARFSKFAFVFIKLFCYVTKLLNDWSLGQQWICFPRISMFPSTSSRETLRFSGNKIHCSPRDKSLSVYYNPPNNFWIYLLPKKVYLLNIPALSNMVNERISEKRKLDKEFPSKTAAITNRLAAELTSRYFGTGPTRLAP